MSEFIEETRINAPVARVWSILADVGAIADWNPGLRGSRATNTRKGLGATRFCDIDGRQNLDEEVVQFEPMNAITFRITRSTLPFESADIRFTLTEERGQTGVAVAPKYTLKYGPVGQLIDSLYVSRVYRRGMQGLLQGLKEAAESV